MNQYGDWDHHKLLRAIDAVPEDPNEEFNYGTFTAGFVVGQTDQSAGVGLLLSFDINEPEPGFQVIIGPLSFWWRRHFALTVSLLHWILYPEKKRAS